MKSLWVLATLYVEVLINLLVLGLIVLMESNLGFMTDLTWVLLKASLMVRMTETTWVHL